MPPVCVAVARDAEAAPGVLHTHTHTYTGGIIRPSDPRRVSLMHTHTHTFHIDLFRQKHGKFGMTIEPVCRAANANARTHTPNPHARTRALALRPVPAAAGRRRPPPPPRNRIHMEWRARDDYPARGVCLTVCLVVLLLLEVVHVWGRPVSAKIYSVKQ